jgi:hypothetical protein
MIRIAITLRALIIVTVMVASITSALARPVYCSVWNGIRTCSSPDGYVSHETTWNGITTGDDNQGDHWTTSRWRDIETTTVEPHRPDLSH